MSGKNSLDPLASVAIFLAGEQVLKVGDLVKREDQSTCWSGVVVKLHGEQTGLMAEVHWNNPYLDPLQRAYKLEIISERR